MSQLSPLPQIRKQVKELDFYEALKEVMNGGRITRIEWGDSQIYGVLEGEYLKIFIDGELKNWILSEGDINATDWIVIE